MCVYNMNRVERIAKSTYVCTSLCSLVTPHVCQFYKMGNALHHLLCTTPFLDMLELKGRQRNKQFIHCAQARNCLESPWKATYPASYKNTATDDIILTPMGNILKYINLLRHSKHEGSLLQVNALFLQNQTFSFTDGVYIQCTFKKYI